MNPFEMVVLIVAIGAVVSIVRARHGIRRDNKGNEYSIRADVGEAERLREEVRVLKERLAVIERITVDRENSLEREIEQLRDKPLN